MKAKSILLVNLVAWSCLASPPQSGNHITSDDKSERDSDATHKIQHLGDWQKLSQVVGEEIRDDHGERLGKVKDLALDLQNGRIAVVVVGTGGLLGMDEKLVAVPPECFESERPTKTLRLKADRALLVSAPEFRPAQWRDSTRATDVLQVFQRFGVEPYFARDPLSPPPVTAHTNNRGQVSRSYVFNPQNALPRLGFISRATRLAGTTVWDAQNEKIASVDSFVVDLPAGRVVEIVLADGGTFGIHRELSGIPPQSFGWNGDRTALVLDNSLAEFRAAPHFRSSEWSYALEPAAVSDIYATYHVWPYFGFDSMNPGGENVRERMAEGGTIAEKADADMAITERIRQRIQSNEGFSSNSRDIKIITINGRVTMTGLVDTEEEKRLIGKIAARLATAERVDNELEVHASVINSNPPR